MPINFFNADVSFLLKNKTGLKRFILAKFKEYGFKKISINYIFCSDDYLLDINRRFLKHDYFTDIITFPLYQDDASIEAELYISVDRIVENYHILNLKRKKGKATSQEDELHRVMFHGLLHLLGQKDKTKEQKDKMRRLEDKWIKDFYLFI